MYVAAMAARRRSSPSAAKAAATDSAAASASSSTPAEKSSAPRTKRASKKRTSVKASAESAAKKPAKKPSKKTATSTTAPHNTSVPVAPPASEAPAPTQTKAIRTKAGSERVVAIIGAFGALGRRLLKRLENDDSVDKIVAVDVRSGMGLLEEHVDDATDLLMGHPKLSAHTLDLTTPGADRELADILLAEGVSSLFHLAFLSTPTHHKEMAHELETIGTHYVLHAAAEAGLHHVVSLSSAMCYGARPDNPAFLTEEHPLRPPPARALKDKADADAQARKLSDEYDGITVAVARLGAMLPTARDHFWTRLFSRRLVPAVLGYDPLMQLLHPSDAVDALLALWRSRSAGAFNVVGQGYLPLSHILTRLERAPFYVPAGLGKSLVSALWQAQLIDMPHHYLDFLRWPWLCDDSKIRKETGFIPSHDLATVLNIVAAQREERS